MTQGTLRRELCSMGERSVLFIAAVSPAQAEQAVTNGQEQNPECHNQDESDTMTRVKGMASSHHCGSRREALSHVFKSVFSLLNLDEKRDERI